MSKAAEKFSNLSPEELKQQEREQMDQLFRLKFQLKMGQSESLNKIRSLRRNVARLKTYRRQHELGIHAVAAPKTEVTASTATVKATAKKTSSKKTATKSAARKAGKK